MRKAKEIRRAAREALRRKWLISTIAAVIAAVFSGLYMGTGRINTSIFHTKFDNILTVIQESSPVLSPFIYVIFLIGFIWICVPYMISFLFGTIIEAGYDRFNLDLIDGKKPDVLTLLSFFSHWGKALAMGVLRWLFIFFRFVLLFVPGIIALYSYSMSTYILIENPNISAKEALRRSKEMMKGNKFRLFCLQCSFIGWTILSVLTCGIGLLWLLPYEKAAITDFYREVSGTRKVLEIPAESAPEAAEQPLP